MSFQQYLDWDRMYHYYLLSKRKKSALITGMHIISMNDHFHLTDGSISVNVTGHTKKRYVVSFSKNNISCTCPDQLYHGHLNLVCKHIFFVIHLSENNIIINNTTSFKYLNFLMNQILIDRIRLNILKIIDTKRKCLNIAISVIDHKRCDKCPICYDSFDNKQITMCNVCKYIFHMNCIVTAWSNSFANNKCPCCRAQSTDNKLLCDNNENDPWLNFNFEIVDQPIQVN
jgi:hypothetical protein